MIVAGADGCHDGWVWCKLDTESGQTSVELVDVAQVIQHRPENLMYLAIDIPSGLMDGKRACDLEARKLLGQPRGSSVFPAPCRGVLNASCHEEACSISFQLTGKRIPRQCW